VRMPFGAIPTIPQTSGHCRPGLLKLVPLLAKDAATMLSSAPRNAPPTLMTAGSLEGQPAGPPFPAATQMTIPEATALLMVIRSAAEKPTDQLHEMTCAPAATARPMAAEAEAPPREGKILKGRKEQPGATASAQAAIPVPWPTALSSPGLESSGSETV